jgi:carbon starvation protein
MFAPSGLIATAAEREVQRQWDAPQASMPGERHAG